MTKMLGKKVWEAECDTYGKWRTGKELPGQSYVQHLDIGKYRVVHNADKLFNVGLSLRGELGLIQLTDISNVAFAVEISIDGEPKDLPFYMCISEAATNG